MTGSSSRSTTRSRILKIWSTKYGLTLKPDSLSWLETMVEHFNLSDPDDDQTVSAFNESMEKMCRTYTDDIEDYSQIVGVDDLEEVYKRLQDMEDGADEDGILGNPHGGAAGSSSATSAGHVRVIDAFELPWLTYDAERKAFAHRTASTGGKPAAAGGGTTSSTVGAVGSNSSSSGGRRNPSLAGSADSKAQYLRDRYNILKQVILRNEHFSPPALPGHDRENYMKLTSIKNLLGRQGGHFLLFGMLTRTSDGSFHLEDLDDSVELDLREAVPASGIFTEGCFALVDGKFEKNNVFRVWEIGHPPSEKRQISRSIYGHVDFLGTGPLTLTEEQALLKTEKTHPEQFLVFSDLHLDVAKNLDNFRRVLQVYEDFAGDMAVNGSGTGRAAAGGKIPKLCIICGNFTSTPVNLEDGKGLDEYKTLFSGFADLILAYPRCARDMQFVFVPGPHDPYDVSNTLLPRRSLPNSLVSDVKRKLPNVKFASNPCRVLYKSQEIVVFREDLMGRMLRNNIRLKDDLSSLAERQLAEELEQEILDQEEEEEKKGNGMGQDGSDNERAAVRRRRRVRELTDDEKGEARRKILSQFLVQTVLDQSHLAPLPLQVRPILWEHDQALRLFPLPTAVVLADKYLPYEVTYEDCHVFNPGGFAGTDFTWSVYHTGERVSEQSGFPN